MSIFTNLSLLSDGFQGLKALSSSSLKLVDGDLRITLLIRTIKANKILHLCGMVNHKFETYTIKERTQPCGNHATQPSLTTQYMLILIQKSTNESRIMMSDDLAQNNE